MLLKLLGLEIPKSTIIGRNISFPHLGGNIVIHPDTIIGDNVRIFHGVTIGRADVQNSRKNSLMEKIIIEDGAILCSGAKILCKEGTLIVGKGTIVGANAVLTQSTGENEVWVGIPARKISSV
ncbi:serine O-acetyltransferase [Aerococcus viridans]|uniref:serine O-acetyltransferase n=1 Tax=Aerococcus viridans TaxID=1377 RepID=UPI003B20F823